MSVLRVFPELLAAFAFVIKAFIPATDLRETDRGFAYQALFADALPPKDPKD